VSAVATSSDKFPRGEPVDYQYGVAGEGGKGGNPILGATEGNDGNASTGIVLGSQ
jgi:hypothetical protein